VRELPTLDKVHSDFVSNATLARRPIGTDDAFVRAGESRTLTDETYRDAGNADLVGNIDRPTYEDMGKCPIWAGTLIGRPAGQSAPQ
jgi:hypothetical protein